MTSCTFTILHQSKGQLSSFFLVCVIGLKRRKRRKQKPERQIPRYLFFLLLTTKVQKGGAKLGFAVRGDREEAGVEEQTEGGLDGTSGREKREKRKVCEHRMNREKSKNRTKRQLCWGKKGEWKVWGQSMNYCVAPDCRWEEKVTTANLKYRSVIEIGKNYNWNTCKPGRRVTRLNLNIMS